MGNRISELLGCKYPILEGGMSYVGNGRLAAAVSEGGGFGQVGSGGRNPDDFAREIEIATAHTSRPFGVNVPISEHHDASPYFSVIEQYRKQIRAVSLSAGNPRPYIAPLHELGFVVMTLASTPEQAYKAELAGADFVICEGTEAGGHDGPAELTTLTLIPLVVRAVSIPVVAAGGIADGRTAAAMFCLGATGVQLGTRFVATMECNANESYKQAIVQGQATDTRVIERSLGHITRVLKGPFVDRILAVEQTVPGDINELLPLISGRKNAIAALSGQMDDGWVYCGTSIGLIADIPSATNLVQRLAREIQQVGKDTALAVHSSFASV